MKINKTYITLSTVAFLTGAAFILFPKHIANANSTGTNIVISQVQTAASGSGNADQEFVELYNPTNVAVDMAGWRLTRKSSGGTQSTLVSNIEGTIAAHGYFLIAHPTYTNPAVTPDLTYSATSSAIANNNTVVLYSDAGQTVVDKVGFGTVALADFETQAFGSNPAADQSIIRKASLGSTATTVGTGGSESTAGNGYDTDNNATDFVLLETSVPHNSSTPIATVPNITPILTSTVTPTGTTITPTQVPTGTISPTSAPTGTPIPTQTISPTTTPTPTPTKTPTPTAMPSPTTVQPTVTKTPTPTTLPTMTNTPTPSVQTTNAPTPTTTDIPHHNHNDHPKEHHSQPFHFHYETRHKRISVFGKHISLPYPHCSFGR